MNLMLKKAAAQLIVISPRNSLFWFGAVGTKTYQLSTWGQFGDSAWKDWA